VGFSRRRSSLTIILDYGFSRKFVFDFVLVFDMAVTLPDIDNPPWSKLVMK
jgi:hypothetical protein